MIWLKIDDPLDAVAVHSGGGMLGVLVTPLVISKGGVFDAENGVTAMHQVWSQLVGILVITAWSAMVSSVMFYILKLNKKLRVSREMEFQGLDLVKHGEAAYPAEAWREVQYGDDGELGQSLPPNMISRSSNLKTKLEEKEYYEMKPANKIEKSSTENKMIGSWSKVNKNLKKQMLNLEDYKDSEVILTVRPIGFRKLSSVTRLVSETDTESTVSYVEEKKQDIGGFTNDAFEDDDDSVDQTDSQEDKKPVKETTVKISGIEEVKDFHSSTLNLDNPKSDRLSAKMDFEDDGFGYPRDEAIYEQVPEFTNDKPQHPLVGPMQMVLDENEANLTLEFNNSR